MTKLVISENDNDSLFSVFLWITVMCTRTSRDHIQFFVFFLFSSPQVPGRLVFKRESLQRVSIYTLFRERREQTKNYYRAFSRIFSYPSLADFPAHAGTSRLPPQAHKRCFNPQNCQGQVPKAEKRTVAANRHTVLPPQMLGIHSSPLESSLLTTRWR